MTDPRRAALVTGCSSGIGRATALALSDKGFAVYATARRPEALTDLAARGCETLALDVTSEESMVAAVRAQFETNVFGLVRMCQLVLPGMRAAGRGRIVNIGSMGGRFTFPGGGFYHASKHAVEAVSDALRLEVAPFGVQVVLVQPGPVVSSFVDSAVDSVEVTEGPYAQFTRALVDRYRAA